jgi:Protein of unknown function (DUF3011)
MKQLVWLVLLSGLALGSSKAWAQSGITQQNGRSLTCASDDMKRHTCRVDTSRGVTLVNQRSGSPCIQGQTWGYSRSGIWVDRGCRADFYLASNYRPGGPGGYPGGPGGPGGYPGGGNGGRPMTVTCSSNNGKRNYCPTNVGGGVRLTNQRSGSPCVQGQTWGYDNRGIWVDRGCRADFTVGYR